MTTGLQGRGAQEGGGIIGSKIASTCTQPGTFKMEQRSLLTLFSFYCTVHKSRATPHFSAFDFKGARPCIFFFSFFFLNGLEH